MAAWLFVHGWCANNYKYVDVVYNSVITECSLNIFMFLKHLYFINIFFVTFHYANIMETLVLNVPFNVLKQ